MGQFWTIYNIDKKMSIDSLGKFCEAFGGGRAAASLVKLLSSPGVTFPKDPLEGQPYKEPRKRKSSKTGICDLPCELHDAIFAELCNPVDVIALCLTASHFWSIGLCHYKALYMDHIRHAEDWSGDRLICLGEYSSDYPESILHEEIDLLMEAYTYYRSREPRNINQLLRAFSHSLRKTQWPDKYDFLDRCRLNEWSHRSRKYSDKHKIHVKDDEPVNDFPEVLPLYKYNFDAWLSFADALRRREYQGDEVNDGSRVLRNLSKKVYVRQDALALTSDDQVYYMSLGSLVLGRITWSSDDSGTGTDNDPDLHRGVWAGDRFDIVSLEVVEGDEGWTDVSVAARKQLDEMWEDAHGSGWEYDVCKRGL